MPVNVLFSAAPEAWPRWAPALEAAFGRRGLDVRLVPELAADLAPDEVDYIVYAPNGGLDDFSPFTRARAVLSLWAGVERIVGNPTLTQPLARMVDPGLEEGMVEYVTGHVLRHHLGLDEDIRRTDARWQPHVPPLARARKVAVLGLGALGGAVAQALAGLNFRVAGWSRRPREIAGIEPHAGPEGLERALSGADFAVTLLPLTPETENILDARTLGLLAPGAVVINPGRGALIDDAALLAALDAGQLGHATLDTFRTEPLPPEHPFWAHPKVTVTPHIASETRPETAAEVIAENIARGEAGAPFSHLVDREAGY